MFNGRFDKISSNVFYEVLFAHSFPKFLVQQVRVQNDHVEKVEK